MFQKIFSFIVLCFIITSSLSMDNALYFYIPDNKQANYNNMIEQLRIDSLNKGIHLAVMHDEYEKLKNLIDNGADINNQEIWFNDTPLHEAVFYRHSRIIELLLTKGAQVNIQNKMGDTPLHVAMRRQNIPIIQKLIGCNANPNIKNKDGRSAHKYLFFRQEIGRSPHGCTNFTHPFTRLAHATLLEG